MQSVFKCDHCSETDPVPELIIAHEIDCGFNPVNKLCWTCKHNSPDHHWYVCDKKVPQFEHIWEDQPCEQWENKNVE